MQMKEIIYRGRVEGAGPSWMYSSNPTSVLVTTREGLTSETHHHPPVKSRWVPTHVWPNTDQTSFEAKDPGVLGTFPRRFSQSQHLWAGNVSSQTSQLLASLFLQSSQLFAQPVLKMAAASSLYQVYSWDISPLYEGLSWEGHLPLPAVRQNLHNSSHNKTTYAELSLGRFNLISEWVCYFCLLSLLATSHA